MVSSRAGDTVSSNQRLEDVDCTDLKNGVHTSGGVLFTRGRQPEKVTSIDTVMPETRAPVHIAVPHPERHLSGGRDSDPSDGRVQVGLREHPAAMLVWDRARCDEFG